MASKAKSPEGKQSGKGPVPKKRFPEFAKAGPWEVRKLGEVAEFPSDKVKISSIQPEEYISTENLQPNFGGVLSSEKLPTTNVASAFKKGDILISNIRPYLRKVWHAGWSGGASNDVIVVRAKSASIEDVFLHFVLTSDVFIDYVMSGAKGVKMPRGDVSLIRTYPLPLPSLAEQRKIADCLSSLDALIGAHSERVEALRRHKKGLMQRLFPAQGESTPKLRFPEFRKAGKWEVRKAGSLFSNRITKGETGLPIYSVTMHDGMVRRDSFDRDFYDIEDATGNKKVCKNDIAYNMMRMWQGALGVAAEDCLVSPAYVVLEPQKDAVSNFFQYLFKLPQSLLLLTSHSRGLTKDRLRLYYDDFARIPLPCPSPAEQRRIVDCLSSLDALIAAEAARVEALRTHKRGLMQQLFPPP